MPACCYSKWFSPKCGYCPRLNVINKFILNSVISAYICSCCKISSCQISRGYCIRASTCVELMHNLKIIEKKVFITSHFLLSFTQLLNSSPLFCVSKIFSTIIYLRKTARRNSSEGGFMANSLNHFFQFE